MAAYANSGEVSINEDAFSAAFNEVWQMSEEQVMELVEQVFGSHS